MAKKAAPKAAEKAAPAPTKPKPAAAKAKAPPRPRSSAPWPRRPASARKRSPALFDAMSELIAKELGKKGPGQFVIPGLLKLKVVRKPATKAKQGINPFTKEPMTVKAKPARNVVKAVPMKALKELV